MIIKLYTTDNKLYIIEDAEFVSVLQEEINLTTTMLKDYENGIQNEEDYSYIRMYEPLSSEDNFTTNSDMVITKCKAIYYFDRAEEHRVKLLVLDKAYICNNDGKTIEKVENFLLNICKSEMELPELTNSYK